MSKMSKEEMLQRELALLGEKKANYDVTRLDEFTEINGWHVDSYAISLPAELIGPPAENGSFSVACDVLTRYEFPDPTILSGFFELNQPLSERVMLLEARFWWMRFKFGVRVSKTIDEIKMTEDGPISVWGYGYQTLEGHWEMGEIMFKITKHHESGAVQFLINAYSKVGRIPNPIYRLGFAVFGRNLQIKFAQRALERMHELVSVRLKDISQTR